MNLVTYHYGKNTMVIASNVACCCCFFILCTASHDAVVIECFGFILIIMLTILRIPIIRVTIITTIITARRKNQPS